jgi:dolichyl-phosphate beta-glucosyltransferase
MFNEQDRIEPTVRDVITTLRDWSRGGPKESARPWMFREESAVAAEILLVNDGSRDRTQAVAEALLRQLLAPSPGPGTITGRVLNHDRNQGKGAAIRTGMASARGEWVLLMDADNATRLDQLARFERAYSQSRGREPHDRPVAMFAASRNTPDADIEAKWTRRLSGNIFKAALWGLGLRLAKDTQCGFKLYRRDLAQYLARHSRENGFAFDIEHFLLCRYAGWDFREVGVHWEHKPGGKINVITDGLKMVARAKAIRDRIRRDPPPPPAPESVPAPVVIEAKPAGAPAQVPARP